jgi:hypothetical protein
MPQIRVLSKGARIAGGVICLFFAVHTWFWVVRDVVVVGGDESLKLWLGTLRPEAGGLTDLPVTTAGDLGLGMLQLVAAFAAFSGAWTAGGLLASAAALTFFDRLPVIWAAALSTESSRFYTARGLSDNPELIGAVVGCVLSVILAVGLALVLMAGLRPWPSASAVPGGTAGGWPPGAPAVPPQSPKSDPPPPGGAPERPTGTHVAVAALFLGLLTLIYIGWNIYTLSESGAHFWFGLFTGQGMVGPLLTPPAAWSWLTTAGVCAVGVILALGRQLAARGYTLGLAVGLLAPAALTLWGYIETGHFFDAAGPLAVVTYLGRAQVVVTLLGAVTLLALALRPGVRAEPRPQPFPPSPPSYGPQPPHPQPQPQPQPYFPQQPGPAGPYAPPAGPPPNAGAAYGYPSPPDNPGPPGGGYGPPPTA